jgi:hypothetical protein
MAVTLITNTLNKKAPPKFQTNLAPNIDILELDAAVHETHDYTNTITDFPVEKGFSISDHVFKVPEHLTMEGFVTNSPIPYSLTSVTVLLDRGNRVNTAFERLLDLAGYDPSGQDYTVLSKVKLPAFLRVVTGLRVYSNMIITHLSFPRDITTGESLRFTCELRKVTVVDSERAIINNSSELNGKAPNIPKNAQDKVAKGSQAPIEPPVDKGTTLLRLINKIGSLSEKIGL